MPRAAQYDVLIAGAGPAGAHTALRLARRGWRVGLVDSRTFPRKKPCGEFLSPACLPHLEELGLLEALEGAGAVRVAGMDIETARHQARGDYLPMGPYTASHGCGLGIRREVLDEQAVEAAGRERNVTTLFAHRVSRPLQDADGRVIGLEVHTPDGRTAELRARFVVGADGLRSRVARGLGLVREGGGPARFALVARFEGVADRRNAALHVIGRDYFAACPIDDGLFTANLVVDGKELPKGASNLEAFFLEHLAHAPGLADRLAGARLSEPIATCGPLRSKTHRCTGPGVALVGDACGFVDPMTGEGLYFAMEGARLVAEAVDLALREPRRESVALVRYERARKLHFGPRYALARLLQLGLRRPGVPDRVIGTLARIPALCHVLLGLTGDYVPPSGLLLPSVWRSALYRGNPAAG